MWLLSLYYSHYNYYLLNFSLKVHLLQSSGIIFPFKNPSDIVSVGDIVKVKVIKIDTERQKVGLSMKI